MKIRLNAQDRLVGYFDIPHYNPMPDVVTWGTRVFKMRTEGNYDSQTDVITIDPVEPPPQDDCQLIYDECFAVAITGEWM